MWPHGSCNIWQCPPIDNGAIQWWCGNSSDTTPCQIGVNASFVSYIDGTILGLPPVTSSPSTATKDFSNIVTTTFSAGGIPEATTVTASSLAKTFTDNLVSAQPTAQSSRRPTNPPAPTQTQDSAANLPTAIGVGISVPLGIATIGLLGFLFWKEAARQRRSKPRILSQLVLDKGEQSAVTASKSPCFEMPDDQRPGELGGNSRSELSNTQA